MNKIKKSDVIESLRTCAKMRNAYHNHQVPSKTYDPLIEQIENVLKALVKGAKVEVID